MNPIEVTKKFLANSDQYSHMQDGKFSVTDHDPNKDAHMVNQLDGVEHSDIQDNNYHVVTVQKNIPVEGGITIPKIVKVQISKEDNSIQSILESK
jgi:hypothetical protein